jgi:nucleoside-diphosphate-sugar epimerase
MDVFIAGATGYLGRHLVPALLARNHGVRALVRPGRVLPAGVQSIEGDALDGASYRDTIGPADTFVHLVGVPNPTRRRAADYLAVDLTSLKNAVEAAQYAGVRHFIYVSVAQPAPVMKDYIAARAQGEAILRAAGMEASILRPWYVLGPGHRAAHALRPIYALLERIPTSAEMSRRLGLVTIDQMIGAMLFAVENPASRILDVPAIRTFHLTDQTAKISA